MTRPLPRPPLFPYTTLFRSRKSRLVPVHASTLDRLRRYREDRDRIYPAPLTPAFFVSERGRRLPYPTVRAIFRRLCEDRKSTRLNSSHTVNSYAVLCLTKKK